MSGTVRSRLHPDFQGEGGKQLEGGRQLEGAVRDGETQREANERATQTERENIHGEPTSSHQGPEDSQPERQDTRQAPENTVRELEDEWAAWQDTLRAWQSRSPRGGPLHRDLE